jgi:hypothetical protein
VHLVGFIIRIYHDARSSECQILFHGFNTVFNLDAPHSVEGRGGIKQLSFTSDGYANKKESNRILPFMTRLCETTMLSSACS